MIIKQFITVFISVALMLIDSSFLMNTLDYQSGLFTDAYKWDKFDFGQNSKLEKTEVPILLLHDIDDDGVYSISKDQFERQMKLIKDSGFNTISFTELYDFTFRGKKLPENPIIITFDDGYQSNYDIAYPILKELNMKATIYVIGHSIGKDTYKNTEHKIIPHFGYDEAIEMFNSGLIDIQSHSFDMHQSKALEQSSEVRNNVKRFKDESIEDYIKIFNSDFITENEIINKITNERIHSFSYPTGYYDQETEALLALLGVKSTLTTQEGINTIIKGLPQSLFSLKRINIYRDMPDENLIKLISTP